MACLLAQGQTAFAQNAHTLPLVPSVSDTGLEGFVRIVNHSNQAGTVRIHAIDDTGRRFGPASLSLGAKQAVHLRSRDLERGNASKGLPAGVGDGEGHWRLELDTALTIAPQAYIRTADGFLTSMHDLAPEAGMCHHVPFFNPGSNLDKQSWLRLINPSNGAAQVTITARDDTGETAPGGDVRLTLAAGAAQMLSAQDLESGASGFSGSFGDGAGKWQLFVSSDRAIQAMSLLRSSTGHLANLSTAPFEPSADECTPEPASPSDDHGDTQATATLVRAPSSTAGDLESGGDKDYFRIDLPRAGRLQVRTTGSTDTYGTLFQDSSVVATNDDGGASLNFLITVEAQAGTWYVEVRGYDSATTGGYTLQVEFSEASPPTGDLYGAIAAGYYDRNDCARSGYAASIAWNHSSRRNAESAVLDACSRRITGSCEVLAWFRNGCGALAYGQSNSRCLLQSGVGTSVVRAEQDAITRCRAQIGSCTLVTASGGGRFAECTSNVGAAVNARSAGAGESSGSSSVLMGIHGSRESAN